MIDVSNRQRPFTPAILTLLLCLTLSLVLSACGGSSASPDVGATSDTPSTDDTADGTRVGRPQTRGGIGDVDAAFARYEDTRSDLIDLFRDQPWFQDGLSRDESLFVERGLTFVARYSGPRAAYVSNQTIESRLFKYEKVPLRRGDMELLLIYEPGQNPDAEMSVLRRVIPTLETLVGVQFPERVMTVINGSFEINDFNDGQFIRIARCCTQSAFVLAHELAHTYWSMGPSWFNEGLADIYANLALEKLNKESPAGWRPVPADLDGYFQSRKRLVDSGRFPDITLTRRLASDGLYETADVFLLELREQLGPDAFATATKELYLASDFGRVNLREKRIEDVFLAQAKPSARDNVMGLFNRFVWGDDGEKYQELLDLDGS